MTQSIIIYRNPAEAALWESGLMWPLMVAMCVSLVLAVVASTVWGMVFKRGSKLHDMQAGVCVAAALIGMLATLKVML